ncbi:hypothetical protein [Streptosporangium carneum]|uniref:Uncharacterized protein n=1 Tax=Streptosporangium carneum TaxID=47481 RepID=A0A9W6MHU3_9ACTN|nr:hypothetical protein [Streptosporangium carneum]GLK14308.1 hypothetical protein GCM10017600_77200 [Streptosporangium carneum]
MVDPGVAYQLDVIRWHISRSEAQRAGLWTRAAAVLSANTLVIAGAALMLTLGTRSSGGSLIAALVALVFVLVSTFEIMRLIAAVRDWGRSFPAADSPTPLIFCMSDTVQALETFVGFREVVESWTPQKELDAGVSELWRISVLHRNRIYQLRRAARWLILSIVSLVVSGTLAVFALWPGF